ncbi:hypothetical protein ACLOJK_029341 [Asimina triloba]
MGKQKPPELVARDEKGDKGLWKCLPVLDGVDSEAQGPEAGEDESLELGRTTNPIDLSELRRRAGSMGRNLNSTDRWP